MRKSLGHLADRLLSIVVPKSTAGAQQMDPCYYKTRCEPCGEVRGRTVTIMCCTYGCSVFRRGTCGSC
ncbi:hypothetical protein [Bailinhaonella thermotolerans]|uniref:Uncharacterized protein n=1 Tax=Bailinhaonella thermotolerans TaxID=1070861 RepID=A0A3A4A9C8_9ACTN|nr:hypothetical protein [Bailinhaonella thermotolerans]RJL24731.1 hypothetical protein D5H75_28465 [Bailinhaonella thermotolerans]